MQAIESVQAFKTLFRAHYPTSVDATALVSAGYHTLLRHGMSAEINSDPIQALEVIQVTMAHDSRIPLRIEIYSTDHQDNTVAGMVTFPMITVTCISGKPVVAA